MKKLLLSASVAVLALSSCNNQGSSVSSLKTMSDSVSYAYGTFVGTSVKAQVGTDNEDFDMNVFAAAIQNSMKGDSSLLTETEIQATLQNYFTNVKPAKDKAKDQAFIDGIISKNSKAIKTESGLIYEIVEVGDESNKATEQDTVSVLYTGKYTNDEVFDSTSKRNNEPAELILNNVVQGFKEGMQLVGKGGKINLWIPAELGYGDKLLIFEVEVVDVKKATTPAPVK